MKHECKPNQDGICQVCEDEERPQTSYQKMMAEFAGTEKPKPLDPELCACCRVELAQEPGGFCSSDCEAELKGIYYPNW